MKNKRTVYFLIFSFFGCLSFMKTYAQGDHFIYIQADAKQAFKAVVNNKNYNSSAIGYLIVPGLSDGNCNVAIRFPEDSFVQLNFPLTINGKDEGFQLKNFGAKGWGLFNLQTMDVTFSGAQIPATDQNKTAAKSKAFGDMLSDVVNDSTLNKTVAQPATNNTTVAAPPSQPAVSTPSTQDLSANQTPSKPVVNDAPVVASNTPAVQTSTNNDVGMQNAATSKTIIKTLQESSAEGTKMIFVDAAGDKNDTVNIFIPAVEISSDNNAANAINTGKNVASSAAQQNQTNTNTSYESNQPANNVKNNTNPFYAPGNNATANSSENITVSTQQPATSNCAKMAEESDLYKLRKKMIAETDANEMIVVAKKQLKGKCLSTDQVKGIGALFLSDEARYNFYEAMYKFTYDPANYISLQNQLLDDYYRKRFQALVH